MSGALHLRDLTSGGRFTRGRLSGWRERVTGAHATAPGGSGPPPTSPRSAPVRSVCARLFFRCAFVIVRYVEFVACAERAPVGGGCRADGPVEVIAQCSGVGELHRRATSSMEPSSRSSSCWAWSTRARSAIGWSWSRFGSKTPYERRVPREVCDRQRFVDLSERLRERWAESRCAEHERPRPGVRRTGPGPRPDASRSRCAGRGEQLPLRRGRNGSRADRGRGRQRRRRSSAWHPRRRRARRVPHLLPGTAPPARLRNPSEWSPDDRPRAGVCERKRAGANRHNPRASSCRDADGCRDESHPGCR